MSILTLVYTYVAVDCSKFSDDRYSRECQEREDLGVGVFVVASVLILAIGFVVWRVLLARSARRDAG